MWIIGDNLLRKGNPLEAKKVYLRAMERFEDHPGTTFRLARSHDALGETEEAERIYRSLIIQRPADVLPLTHLVSLLGRTGRVEEALRLAREKAEGKGAPQLLLLGSVLEKTGRYSQAQEVYLTLNERYPDLITPYQRVVATYAREGKLGDAQVWLAEAIEKSTSPGSRILMLHGIVQDTLGEREAAMKIYRKILERHPDFVPALNNLAWDLLESGQLDEALEVADQAKGMAPEDASVADTYGWILYRSGDSAGALIALRQAARGLPENPIVREHLVQVLQAVGRTKEAEEYSHAVN